MLAIKKLDDDLRLHVNLCISIEKDGKYFPVNLDCVNQYALKIADDFKIDAKEFIKESAK